MDGLRHRIQYSVYEIDNSPQLLENIIQEINNIYSKKFGPEDSVYIFRLSQTCKVIRLGYAKNEEKDFVIILIPENCNPLS